MPYDAEFEASPEETVIDPPTSFNNEIDSYPPEYWETNSNAQQSPSAPNQNPPPPEEDAPQAEEDQYFNEENQFEEEGKSYPPFIAPLFQTICATVANANAKNSSRKRTVG